MIYPSLPVGNYAHDAWVVWITIMAIVAIAAFVGGWKLAEVSLTREQALANSRWSSGRGLKKAANHRFDR